MSKVSPIPKGYHSITPYLVVKGAAPQSEKPKIPVLCNLKLPSCRKWLALAEMRVHIKEARLTGQSARR